MCISTRGNIIIIIFYSHAMKLSTCLMVFATLAAVTDAMGARSVTEPSSSRSPSKEDICLYNNKPRDKDGKVEEQCTGENNEEDRCSIVWKECKIYDMTKETCSWFKSEEEGRTTQWEWCVKYSDFLNRMCSCLLAPPPPPPRVVKCIHQYAFKKDNKLCPFKRTPGGDKPCLDIWRQCGEDPTNDHRDCRSRGKVFLTFMDDCLSTKAAN